MRRSGRGGKAAGAPSSEGEMMIERGIEEEGDRRKEREMVAWVDSHVEGPY